MRKSSLLLFLIPVLFSAKTAHSQSGALTSNTIKVKPINWSSFHKKPPHDELAKVVKTSLLNANKFALSTWYRDIKKYQQD